MTTERTALDGLVTCAEECWRLRVALKKIAAGVPDMRRVASAALAAYEPISPWRPIAQIPADGTWFFGRDEKSGALGVIRPEGPGSTIIEGATDGFCPTQFMPIPE